MTNGASSDTSAPVASVPAFSVVVPLFNKCNHVRGTVERILAQDHPAFEVIVVDDGSTDDSVARIADLAGPRLRILHQPNAGPGAARNLGIAHARHDWIAFIDADDAWYPDHLSELARAIAACPAAGMASTAYRKHAASADLPPRPADGGTPRQTSLFEACRRRNVVCASTTAVRRDVFARVGGFRVAYPGEDTDMWVRIGLEEPLAFSSRVTAIYTMDTGGLSETSAGDRRSGRDVRPTGPENPIYALLGEKLRDPALAPLHGAIRLYLDARAITVGRNAIFDGDQPRARAALRRVRGRRGRYLAYAALAHLPAPLFACAYAIWRRARRLLRRGR